MCSFYFAYRRVLVRYGDAAPAHGMILLVLTTLELLLEIQHIIIMDSHND